MVLAAESATVLGIIPLAFLWGLQLAHHSRDAAWWWLAGAFAVSWVADNLARGVPPWATSLAYPVAQAGIVGAVLLDRDSTGLLVSVLAIVGLFSVAAGRVEGPDILLRTVAWGSVAAIVWDRPLPGTLWWSLEVTFGLGLLCWWGYAVAPGWSSWIGYQVCRAVGIGLFCAAALHPQPRLRLA